MRSNEVAVACSCVPKPEGWPKGGGGRVGLFCQQNVNLFFARLSHMISLNTQDGVCPSGWQLRALTLSPTPSLSHPLTPTSASLCLEVLAFYLPPRGCEKADKAFHSLPLTVRFLDQCNPRMAGTRVQRFGCSLTTYLTTKTMRCWFPPKK